MNQPARRLPLLTEPVDYPAGAERPVTRGDCVGGERPCPFVSCKHHLAIDVSPNGTLRVNADVEGMAETCALDVADRAGTTLEEIASIYGVVEQAISRTEINALRKLKLAGARLKEFKER